MQSNPASSKHHNIIPLLILSHALAIIKQESKSVILLIEDCVSLSSLISASIGVESNFLMFGFYC